MEQLPNHLKIAILNFIPRRVHSAAIIMREAIDECEEIYNVLVKLRPWDHERYDKWDYDTFILSPYKEKAEFNSTCDCCAELWKHCQCWCSNCDREYNVCKYSCYQPN